jgi:hypothetical protein
MKYTELSRFLNRRQVEISTDRGYIVSQKALADESDTSPRSMGHWFDGNAKPEPESWPGLYRVFGKGFYTSIGHPELEPEMDPDYVYLWANKDKDPNVREIYDHAMSRARAYKQERERAIGNVRNVSVTS